MLNISTKCIQSFLYSLTSKLLLSFFPSASLHPAPCIGVPQLSASGFTHSFESLNAAFPRATALLLYHIVSGLSILLDVEHSLLFLSMICEKSIKRAFPLPKEKRSTLFFIEKQPFIRRFSHHTLATTHSSARNKQSSADMPSAAHTTAHRLAVIIIVQFSRYRT